MMWSWVLCDICWTFDGAGCVTSRDDASGLMAPQLLLLYYLLLYEDTRLQNMKAIVASGRKVWSLVPNRPTLEKMKACGQLCQANGSHSNAIPSWTFGQFRISHNLRWYSSNSSSLTLYCGGAFLQTLLENYNRCIKSFSTEQTVWVPLSTRPGSGGGVGR